MKQEILKTISDLVKDFLYYDRKEDEDLSVEDLEKAFNDGEITIDECVEHFRKRLNYYLTDETDKNNK